MFAEGQELRIGEQLRSTAKQVGCAHVGELKRLLREAGHLELAARVGRASTRRNRAAHPRLPDLRLVEEVLAALPGSASAASSLQAAASSQCSSEGSDSGDRVREPGQFEGLLQRLERLLEQVERLEARVQRLEAAASQHDASTVRSLVADVPGPRSPAART